MNDLQIFKNAEFGEIRTVIIENEPWFVGKDVAVILGYADPNKAIAMHVDEDDKLNDKSASSLGQRGGWLIKESGLYSLILSSKLASAKRFKKWVTSEVLPSIRKNGGYIAGQEHLSDDELMAKAVLVAQKKIEERDKVIEEQPTAYDVDKVVEQLNELKGYDVCANISCETCSYTGQCWEGERGQKVAIDRAVEIAKGGGIEW